MNWLRESGEEGLMMLLRMIVRELEIMEDAVMLIYTVLLGKYPQSRSPML